MIKVKFFIAPYFDFAAVLIVIIIITAVIITKSAIKWEPISSTLL